MKIKDKVINVALLAVLLGTAAIILMNVYSAKKQEKNQADATALRSVIAEAYININEDPDFVNTATENQPMEVPEKYYTYVESVQGDGRVYVFVHMDGSVDAYFGSPEKTIGYYVAVTGLDTD